MKPKDFDAIEMKRRGSQRIYEELRGLSQEERRAYWEQANRELEQYIARLRREAE